MATKAGVPKGAGNAISFGGGYFLPPGFSTTVDAPSIPYRVRIDVTYEDSRFVVAALTAERKDGGPPVTSQGLRKIPVQDILRSAVLSNVLLTRPNPRSPGSTITGPAHLPSFRRLSKSGPTAEALEHVGLVYRIAYAIGEPPTQAVTDAFGLPRSTAEKWVRRARAKGLIDIPDPRRRK